MIEEIERLKIKHIELDHKIKSEYSTYAPDVKLQKLKKEKLKIKERIEKLKADKLN